MWLHQLQGCTPSGKRIRLTPLGQEGPSSDNDAALLEIAFYSCELPLTGEVCKHIS